MPYLISTSWASVRTTDDSAGAAAAWTPWRLWFRLWFRLWRLCRLWFRLWTPWRLRRLWWFRLWQVRLWQVLLPAETPTFGPNRESRRACPPGGLSLVRARPLCTRTAIMCTCVTCTLYVRTGGHQARQENVGNHSKIGFQIEKRRSDGWWQRRKGTWISLAYRWDQGLRPVVFGL